MVRTHIYAHAWSSPPYFSMLLMFDAIAALSLCENVSAWAKWMLSHSPPCASPWCGKGTSRCSSSLFRFGHWRLPWTVCLWAPGFCLKLCKYVSKGKGHGTVTVPSEAMLSSHDSHWPATFSLFLQAKTHYRGLTLTFGDSILHSSRQTQTCSDSCLHPCWNLNSLKERPLAIPAPLLSLRLVSKKPAI